MRSHLLSPIVSIALLALLPTALSHGHQVPVSDDADWATRHMAEEHHIANLDPSAFFTLHDYDSSGHWSPDEIRRTYGLDDESAKDVPAEKKINAVNEVIGMFDKDGDGGISKEEWMDGWVKDGKRLPDFGVGFYNCFNELSGWAWRWAKLVWGNFSTWTASMLSYEDVRGACWDWCYVLWSGYSAAVATKAMNAMLIIIWNGRLGQDTMAMMSMSTKFIISRSFMMRVGRSILTLLCCDILTGSTFDRYERGRPHAP